MEAYKLDSTFGLEKLKPLGSDLADLYSASNFRTKSVACVVSQEATFRNVKLGFESLGYEVACSSSLDATFKIVSADPEEWAMIVVRLDQPLDEGRLRSFVRIIRMMDVRVPIMIMTQKGNLSGNNAYPKLYADCVVGEPKSQEELLTALEAAVNANIRWGSKFDDLRREAENYLCQQRGK